MRKTDAAHVDRRARRILVLLRMATGAASPQHPAERIRFRRGIYVLSVEQLALFRQAFQDVMNLPDTDDRGYQYWAGFHGLPGRIECDDAHFRPEFLPWHRAYL